MRHKCVCALDKMLYKRNVILDRRSTNQSNACNLHLLTSGPRRGFRPSSMIQRAFVGKSRALVFCNFFLFIISSAQRCVFRRYIGRYLTVWSRGRLLLFRESGKAIPYVSWAPERWSFVPRLARSQSVFFWWWHVRLTVLIESEKFYRRNFPKQGQETWLRNSSCN